MSGGMPELGSKISLISKADIRYEGRLFTVDPQECTIALANVRSFGTEDRETQYPIAPQSQIYDYILFRGSDIKDIRVVNNGMPHPTDPAIMQMQLPNGQPMMPHFPMPTMAAPLGNYGNPFGTLGNLGGIGSTGLAPGSFGLNKPKQSELNDAIPEPSTITASSSAAEHKDQVSVIDLLTGASRSTTPVSLVSRKSPSADMGVQVNQNRDQMHKRQNQQQRSGNFNGGQRDRRDSGKMMDQHNNQQDRNQRNQMQNNNQNRAWVNRGNNPRGNHRGRGRMQNQSTFRQNSGGNNNKGRPKNTLKFEQDYDFEQANNKFEELRLQLAKLKVGTTEPKAEKINFETDKKDDSGNETGAGEHEQEEDNGYVGYDKAKSFFDNISCEAATDRTNGRIRTDWRQERKLNNVTFGISSTRRGNYRGRGGYNRNNMNMHGGGGYRGYHRGGNNYRGRNNNNNRNGQSTGLPNNKPSQNHQESEQPAQQPQTQQPPQQPAAVPAPPPAAAAAQAAQ